MTHYLWITFDCALASSDVNDAPDDAIETWMVWDSEECIKLIANMQRPPISYDSIDDCYYTYARNVNMQRVITLAKKNNAANIKEAEDELHDLYDNRMHISHTHKIDTYIVGDPMDADI